MNLPIGSSRHRRQNEGRPDAFEAGFKADATIDAASVDGIAARHRRQLVRQLRVVTLVAVILAAGIVVVALWRVQAAEGRRAELVKHEKNARDCLNHGDARCARDAFAVVLDNDPTFPGARDGLEAARLLLAEQYAEAGQFREAVVELDAALGDNPGDRVASVQLRQIFDRWYEDASARGDWPTAFAVDRQRRARFPQAPSPIRLRMA